MKAILLVTWFIAGQPPSSYQTVFNSRDACEAARAQVFADAARVVRKGGRLIVVDMQSHDRAEYRQTLGHLWQGFAAEQIIPWMEEAGFEACRYAPIPLDPKAKGPGLFVGSGVRP